MKVDTPPEIRDLLHRVDALTPAVPSVPPHEMKQIGVNERRVANGPAVRGTARWAAVAVGSLVVIAAGWFVASRPESTLLVQPPATTVPFDTLPPPRDDDLQASRCSETLLQRRTEAPEEWASLSAGEPRSAHLGAAGSAGAWTLYAWSDALFVCEFSNVTQRVAGDSWHLLSSGRTSIEADQLYVDSELYVDSDVLDTANRDDVGPGTLTLIGRVGLEVESVEVLLDDGTRVPGAMGDGWFVIDATVPPGVHADRSTVWWTLEDGITDWDRVDVLAAPVSDQLCVADAACVEQRTTSLLSRIDQDPSHRVLTDDRVLTIDEYTTVLRSYAECMGLAGYEVTVTAHGGFTEFGTATVESLAARSACDRATGRSAALDLYSLQLAVDRAAP